MEFRNWDFLLLRISKSEIPLFEMNNHYFLAYKNKAEEQCLVGSLTGTVDSYNATESYKGWLILDGNQDDSAKA